MDQKYANRDGLDKQDASSPKSNRLPKNSRRIFYFDFWANHPVAIWGGILGSIFVSPILSIPDCTKRDLWFITIGLLVWLACFVYWYFDGHSKHGMPTQEEITHEESEHREYLQVKLNGLEKELEELKNRVSAQEPRRLTDKQKSQLTTSLIAQGQHFRGSKWMIRYDHLGSSDGHDFARDFVIPLEDAGLDVRIGATDEVSGRGVENIAVCISESAAKEGDRIPIQVLGMACLLANMGLCADPTIVPLPTLPDNRYVIWITTPSKARLLPPEKAFKALIGLDGKTSFGHAL